MNIKEYWKSVLRQDAEAINKYFNPNAYIRWHNSNEHFTVEEFIRANCEYPNKWDGEIERLEKIMDLYIAVVNVYNIGHSLSFHVTSFIKIRDDKIIIIDEYWGSDESAPTWRLEKKIGKAIK